MKETIVIGQMMANHYSFFLNQTSKNLLFYQFLGV
jgi:hypothetical protein